MLPTTIYSIYQSKGDQVAQSLTHFDTYSLPGEGNWMWLLGV